MTTSKRRIARQPLLEILLIGGGTLTLFLLLPIGGLAAMFFVLFLALAYILLYRHRQSAEWPRRSTIALPALSMLLLGVITAADALGAPIPYREGLWFVALSLLLVGVALFHIWLRARRSRSPM
jgi:4-hydroxybenzoate polyprenyltransferase